MAATQAQSSRRLPVRHSGQQRRDGVHGDFGVRYRGGEDSNLDMANWKSGALAWLI